MWFFSMSPWLMRFWEMSGVRFLFPNRSLFCGLTIANCKVGMVTEWRVESKQKWKRRWFGNEEEIELENCWERYLGKRHLKTSFWMGKNEHVDIRAPSECLPKCELKRRGFYNKVDKMIILDRISLRLPADIPTSLRCALEPHDHGGLWWRIVTDSATRASTHRSSPDCSHHKCPICQQQSPSEPPMIWHYFVIFTINIIFVCVCIYIIFVAFLSHITQRAQFIRWLKD